MDVSSPVTSCPQRLFTVLTVRAENSIGRPVTAEPSYTLNSGLSFHYSRGVIIKLGLIVLIIPAISGLGNIDWVCVFIFPQVLR